MATGADIPPELIQQILLDVCEDAEWLLDLRKTVPNRKEAIKIVIACSLTCVYWAHICRKRLFWSVWIKNYEDMCAFRSLVSNTPAKFTPISVYVFWATLVQRVGDRPWLHLIQMQPSLFRFWRLRDPKPVFYFHIEDSPNNACNVQCSMFQRLFDSLPRTLPSSCLQCTDLIIDKPHFVTPRDLAILLQKFRTWLRVWLTNVTWSAQTHFEDDLLIRGPLTVPHFSSRVMVRSSAYIAETAWLAFAATMHCHVRQQSATRLTSEYDADKRERVLQVLPSAQRAILDICKSLCQGRSVPSLRLEYPHSLASAIDVPSINTSLEDTRVYNHYFICRMQIEGHETASDEYISEIGLVFYGSTQAVISASDGRNSVVVDRISVLCVYINEPFTAGCPINGMLNQSHPWAEVVGICAAQIAFIRLQLRFNSHNHLVQFMEAQRAALGKLDGRITLFYHTKDRGLRAADFETLADLGDAYEHDYINTYC